MRAVVFAAGSTPNAHLLALYAAREHCSCWAVVAQSWQVLAMAHALGAEALWHCEGIPSAEQLHAQTAAPLILAAGDLPHGGAQVRHCTQIIALTEEHVRVWQNIPHGARRITCAPPLTLALCAQPQTPLPLMLAPPLVDAPTFPTAPAPPPPPRERVILRGHSAEQSAQHILNALHELGASPAPTLPPGATVDERQTTQSPHALHSAPLIIAGGKGFGADAYGEAFGVAVRSAFETLIVPLAAQLGGAPAATRAIIDGAGIDARYQVGQSGRTVRPTVYLAAGIQGAAQHLQGIGQDSAIIAINTDANAPIFARAALGIVDDARAVLAALLATSTQ